MTYSNTKWGEAKKAALGEKAIGQLIWDEFKTKFLGYYFPISEREKKEKEFSDLVYGTHTVQDYTIQF